VDPELLTVIIKMSFFWFLVDAAYLQTVEVMDFQLDRSQDVPLAYAISASLMLGEKSDKPYPVPNITIDIEPDAGPLLAGP
jgi:hypothetical protein